MRGFMRVGWKPEDPEQESDEADGSVGWPKSE